MTQPTDPIWPQCGGSPTREEVERSEAYRGCPFGYHAPDEPHHYSCWAWFD